MTSYIPSLEEAKKLADRGNLAPIYRVVPADLETPVSAFLKVARGKHSFLLESVEGGERLARYSFIGRGARAIFRARGRDVEWVEGGVTQRFQVDGDPLTFLRAKLAEINAAIPEIAGLPPGKHSVTKSAGYHFCHSS